MSITASEMTPADIAAVTNNGGNGFGNGFGGDGWWVLLLWLAMMNGGWGMGGMYGGMMGGMGGFGLYPWLDNSQNINDGFRDQMLNNNVTSIRDGVANLSTQLCNCCGDMQMALSNGFAGVEQGANARQIANMQQVFANQTAMMQGFNASQAQLAHFKKSLLTNEAMENSYSNENGMRREYSRDYSMNDYSGRRDYSRDDYSNARRRDSMGRYSSEGDDVVHSMRELMNRTSDPRAKDAIRQAVSDIERG